MIKIFIKGEEVKKSLKNYVIDEQSLSAKVILHTLLKIPPIIEYFCLLNQIHPVHLCLGILKTTGVEINNDIT